MENKDIRQSLARCQEKLNKEKWKLDEAQKNFIRDGLKKADLARRMVAIMEAIKVVQIVSLSLQKNLEFHVSNALQLSESTVFDDPYAVKLQFDPKRGRTDASILFKKAGDWVEGEGNIGVGCIDIAALGLRFASLQLLQSNPRPIMLLDEPMKHLRGEDEQRRAGQLMKIFSEKMGVQMLVVADVNFTIAADREFALSLNSKNQTSITVRGQDEEENI